MTDELSDLFKAASSDKKKISEQKKKIRRQSKAFETWLYSGDETLDRIVDDLVEKDIEPSQMYRTLQMYVHDAVTKPIEVVAEEPLEPQPTLPEVLTEESLGLLSEPSNVKQGKDPLTPTDQKFATFEDLQNHYRIFLNRIQQQISTIGGGGENNNDGYEYVSDKNLESNPIALSADTWTKVTNDGTSGSTSREHLPEGVTRIYDTTTQRIKLDQLPTNGWLIFRFGIKVNPNVDNLTLKARIKYTLPDGYNFYLVAPGALLNDGAGIEYEEQYTLTFYVGDQDSKDGYGELEVRADGTCSITDSAFMTIVG